MNRSRKKKAIIDWWLSSEAEREYIIPAAFTEFTSAITRVGNSLDTDYDFTALDASIVETACYVDPTAGGGGSGTIGSPFNDLSTAIANTSYNTYYLKAGTRCVETGGMTISRSIKVKKYGSGADPEVSSEITTNSWTVNGTFGNVYEHTNALTSLVVGSVFDESNLDVNGLYTALSRVTSIAEVAATANTFFYDATADIVYVRTFDDRAPDADIVCLVSSTTLRTFRFNQNLVANTKIYMENIRVYGAQPLVINNTSTSFYWDFGFKNCHFSYGGQKDGVLVAGYAVGFFKDCVSDYNIGDGFNYSNSVGFAFEWGCRSWFNNLVVTPANNGSTTHLGWKIIRVEGDYRYNAGKGVQDINDTFAYSLRCISGFSSASDPDNYAFATNSSTGATVVWWIECQGVGPELRGFRNFTNSTANIYDGDYGNLTSLTNREDVGGVKNLLAEGDVYA